MSQNSVASDKDQIKKNLVFLAVILIISITSMFVLLSFLQKPIYKKFTSDNAIVLSYSQITGEGRDFSYYVKTKQDPLKNEFTTQVSKSDIEKIDEEYVTLFTPKMQCEAFEIFLNGKSIAAEGDLQNYNSNLWAQRFNYSIRSDLFSEDINELTIIQYSRYMSGGVGYPFLIDGYNISLLLRNYRDFDVYWAIAGISLFLVLMILLMIFLFKEKRKLYLLMLLTFMTMLIGFFEYFKLSQLCVDFMIFKKIIVSCNLMAVGLGTLYFRIIFNKTKNNLLLILLYVFAVLVPAFAIYDMPTYKVVYTIMIFATAPFIIYWIMLSIKNYHLYTRSRLLLTISLTCLVYLIVWNISETLQLAYLDAVTVILLPAYIVTALTLILIDMHKLKINIEVTDSKFKSAYKKSIADSLTGLYNMDFLKENIPLIHPPYAFVVFDIDDFKNINDTLGHLAGDEALMQLSNVVSSMLREEDKLCRYGGDEFILVLGINSPEQLRAVLERIRKKVETSEFSFDTHKMKMTISLGYYISLEREPLKTLLDKADKALYQAKNQGKNQVVQYTSAEV